VLEKKYIDAIKTQLSSDIPITSSTIEYIGRNPTKYRGSVRISTGAIYTDEEFKKLHKYLLKKLP
jgi:cysteine sulfinate desulfinase/cysteine desulfurase-like protein